MAEKRTIELEIQDNSKSLKAQYKEAVAELQRVSAAYGETSAEAVKAAQAAAQLKDQIGFSKDLVDSFNPDAKFNALSRSIGGVLDGFQAFQGALGLIGVEGEQVQAAMLKVQSAMALSQGIQGVMEAKDSLLQLGTVMKSTAIGQAVLTAATAAYNIVVGTSTGLMKAFRIALISTGIGALVVGIGLLIANFDKVINLFKPLIDGFKAIGDFIGLTDFAAREKAKNDAKRTEEELKRMEAVRKTREKNFNNEQSAYDREIKLQKALGKSTYELEKAKISASIKYQETKKKELEQELLGLKILGETASFIDAATGGAFTARLESLQNEIDKTKNEIENQKTELKILDIEAKKAQQAPTGGGGGGGGGGMTPQQKTDIDVTRRVEDEKLRIREESREKDLDLLALNYKRKLEDAEKELKDDKDKKTKIAALEKQYQESIKADIKSIDDKWDKIEKEARDKKLQEQIKAEDAAWLELQNARNSQREQDLLDLQLAFDEKITAANGNAEIEKAITDKFNKEYAAINKKYADEEIKAEKEKNDKIKAENLKAAQDRTDLALKYAQTFVNVYSSLNNLMNANDNERLKKMEKGSKEEEALKKKMFKRDKALRIVQTVMDTASNVVQSVRNGGGIPTGIPFGIAAATMGALQIAAISKAKFDGGNQQAPSAGGGGAAAPMTANFNTIGSSGINQLAQLQQTPTQAYVVSGEVTSAQALDRNRVQNATL